jgi:pilus assembly protein CpaD
MTKGKFLIIASTALALSACVSPGANTSMYSVHQPVIERTNYAIDIDASGGMVSPTEAQRMSEWFEAMQLRYGDRVAVDYGDGYAAPAVRQTVSGLAENYGLLVGDTAPVTTGAVAPGTVRVVVTRSSASVPSCPDWSSTSERNYDSSNHSNHGCSINSNLAAMIADPEDLVRGRDNKSLDNNTGKNAVNTYRAKTNGGN